MSKRSSMSMIRKSRLGHSALMWALLILPMLVAIHIVSAQVAPAPRPTPLLGTWEAVNRSAGGLGSTMTFSADNTLSYTLGAMVDMQYKRSRDSLYIIDPQNGINAFRVSINRDTLVMTNEGREQRETRVGAPVTGADPVVGRWTYQHYTGVPAFEEYTPGGEFRLRVPIRTLQGTYAVLAIRRCCIFQDPAAAIAQCDSPSWQTRCS